MLSVVTERAPWGAFREPETEGRGHPFKHQEASEVGLPLNIEYEDKRGQTGASKGLGVRSRGEDCEESRPGSGSSGRSANSHSQEGRLGYQATRR